MQKKYTIYWGSVRFFKHVIITITALLIIVPIVLCIIFAMQNYHLHSTVEALSFTPLVQEKDEPVSTVETQPPNAESPGWQNLYPEFYAQPSAKGVVNQEKTVYLTFDDGPSARTPEILKILEQYGIKAAFFVVGKEDEASKRWMRDIVSAGHTLGMHTYSHDYKKVYASVESFLEDYNRIYQLIYDTTGVYPQIARFPGGSINSYNMSNYQEIVAELIRRGFVFFDWNVSSGDAVAKALSSKQLANNALNRVDSLRRSVVLMHDSVYKTTTVEALPTIIEGYLSAGFTFAALTPEVAPLTFTYPN